MKFGQPYALWLLALIGVLVVIDILRRGSLATLWPKVGRLWAGRHSVDLHTPTVKPRPRWLFWSGLTLVVLALAQPRFGKADLPDDETPREVLIALDLSRSMLARDVRPSRLEHAKVLVRGMLDKFAGEHAGLVPFAGSAYLQLPLSPDYEILTSFLPDLSPDAFPKGGSDFTAMLKTALESYSSEEGVQRFLVVLSDGEAFNESWKPLLAQFKSRRIHIISVGIGTTGGAVVPGPNQTSVKDPITGREVISRLNPATLKAFADGTDGRYVDAAAWANLSDVIRRLAATEEKSAARRKDEHRLVERYHWALVPALALLWLSFIRELPVRPAQRKLARGTPATTTMPELARRAATASVLILVSLLALDSAKLRAHDPEPVSSDAAEQESETDDPDRPTPMTRIGSMVGQRITEMLAKGQPSSDDYTALVIDMMAFAENNLKARQRFPNSVLDDALVAIDQGRSINVDGGDWDRFRTELAQMREANNSPWKLAVPDSAGKSDLTTGFDPDHDMQTNGRGSGGVASDPGAQRALDDLKKKVAKNAAFGAMSDEAKKRAAVFAEPPPPPPDAQMVGGQQAQQEQEIEAHPELVLPLQRLALVRAQDMPAKLFRMLDGDDQTVLREGPDW